MIKRCVRGQISVEYLIVVAFVIAIVVGMLGIAFFYAHGVRDQIKINQVTDYGNTLVSTAETVFFAGEPSKTTVEAYLPAGVQSIVVSNDELRITIEISSGTNTISFDSDVPLDDSSDFVTSEGFKKIAIVAQNNAILFSEG